MTDVMPPADSMTERGVTSLTIAAWSSLGAGAIHAAAIGVHAEHRAAALLFTGVAVFQLLWGVVALTTPTRLIALIGAAGSSALVGGWLLAKTSGIGFVDGLGAAEAAQLPDTAAAVLATVVTVLGLSAAMGVASAPGWRPLGRTTATLAVIAVVGLTLPALVSASSHSHEGAGHGDDHAADGHDDADGHHAADPDGGPDDDSAAPVGMVEDHGDHEPAPVPPKPYDPALPIDLGGVDGVTPQQQAAAENLIAITLDRLPKYADPAAAEADGFHTIRDGGTGHEHYIHWDYIDDEHVLDPDYPESLVYEVRDGVKTLVSAMYMLPTGTTLADVPELGGPLTQWHIHDNLCFSDDPVAPWVAGLTNPDGTCSAPLVKHDPVPMIHVWIVPHACGPFASLDGLAAGQIAEGEERLCDHAHGA